MQRLRIALVVSNYVDIKKTTSKGTEIFVYNFLNEIRKFNDIDVTLFASLNSDPPPGIDLAGVWKKSSLDAGFSQKQHLYAEFFHIASAFSQASKFDLFHINLGVGLPAIIISHLISVPILITPHIPFPSDPALIKIMESASPYTYFVSISNSQRKNVPAKLNFAATIYHGVNPHFFNFSPKGSNRLVWAGRATKEKGIEEVITISKKLNIITTLAPLITAMNKDYYFTTIKPRVSNDPLISILENQPHNNMPKLFQNAKLFLFPIRYEEPFGMVMIEAMSCGTPVVAFARGSVPEVIKDGETGFIVNPSKNDIRGNWIIKKTGIEGLIEAVKRIYSMSEEEYRKMRENSRKHVEKNFTTERMVKDYIKTYKKIISSFTSHNSP